MSNCKSNFNKTENSIWAGYMEKTGSFPPSQEGFFLAHDVVATPSWVKGYMIFPQRGQFEFHGSMPKFLTLLKQAGGARASLKIPGLVHWMR